MHAINIIEKSKIKLIKVACAMSVIVTASYSLYYLFGLHRADVAIFNVVFITGYLSPLLFLQFKRVEQATLALLIVLVTHLFIYSYYLFSAKSGFHFYYLLIPSIVFLLLDEHRKYTRLFFTLLGTLLFIVCAVSEQKPFVQIPDDIHQWLFISTVVAIIIEIYLVFHFYSQTINEQALALKVIATVDPLTKVHNRLHFDQVSQLVYEKAKGSQNNFSILLIDIDWFKKINDQYGHIAGDITLKEVAITLKNELRSTDSIARYGGEEFIVLLPNTEHEEAQRVAEKLKDKVANISVNVKEQLISCTVSIGISEFNEPSMSLLQIIDQADKALYKAKDLGRNLVSVY